MQNAQVKPGTVDVDKFVAALQPKPNWSCGMCGNAESPRRVLKGSVFVEIALWMLLFPLGVAYTIWRMTHAYKVCLKCGWRQD